MKSVLERNLGFIGYPNYSVDTEGNVWSLDYKRTGKQKVLKGRPDTNGYLMVSLYKYGISKNYRVHQLVAKAFIPNPHHYTEVNHKNEDKTDNRVQNLEWCSHLYNNNFGTRTERIAEKHSKPVLQINKNSNEVIRVWKSAAEIQREKGYYQSGISACCLGKRKSAYGYVWRKMEYA